MPEPENLETFIAWTLCLKKVAFDGKSVQYQKLGHMSLDIYYPPPITVRHFVNFEYQRQNDYAFHFHMSKTLVLRMQFYFNLCKTISLAGS